MDTCPTLHFAATERQLTALVLTVFFYFSGALFMMCQ